jgi:hypothetical protein
MKTLKFILPASFHRVLAAIFLAEEFVLQVRHE